MPKSTEESLEEAVKLLKDLVDITKATQAVSEQTFLALSYGHAGAGGSSSGSTYHRRMDWRTLIHGPEPDLGKGYTNPARGIGGWIKSVAGRVWKGSKASRWMRTGGRIGAGVGKSLGLGSGATRALAGAGAAAGAAAAVVVAFVAVAKVAWEAYKALNHYTEAAMREAQRLSEVSGSMAAIIGERDMMQMMRDVKKGEGTAGSARALMESEAKRKDQETRLEIVFDNAKNSILAVLNDILANVLQPIADVAEFIADNWPWAKREKDDGPKILGDFKNEAIEASRRIEASGRRLLDDAKDASGAFPGRPVGPAGAAPVGRLP